MRKKLINSVRASFKLRAAALKELDEILIITNKLFIELCKKYPEMTLGEFYSSMDNGKVFSTTHSSDIPSTVHSAD